MPCSAFGSLALLPLSATQGRIKAGFGFSRREVFFYMNTSGKRGRTFALHRFPSPKSDPWIFYSHGKHNRSHTLYSLSERKVHNKCLKEMLDADILCSMHGWLVLSNRNEGRNLRLLNPISMATIQLPLFSRPCSYDFCALSSDPNNPDCIVMLIKDSPGRARFYFCKPGAIVWNEEDSELERDDLCSDEIRAVGCYKGQVCIFTYFEKIYLLEANPPYLTLTNLEVDNSIPYHPEHYGDYKDYLVESDGELFTIRKFDLRVHAYDFEICKLDISGEKKRYVVVDDLGGRAFFLSSFSSGISCYVDNCGIKANTIYFTQPSDLCIYLFDLQKKVLTFSLPCPNVKRNFVQAEWILPLSPNAPCKLDCKVDIIAPQQIKKSKMEQPSISKSIGKDWSRLLDATTNSVVEKLASRFIDRDWSELPQDVLISIAEKMSCVSCARAAIACKRWGSVITWAPKILLGCPIFLHMPSSSNEVFHFVSKGMYNVPFLENLKDLSIQDAKYGWLLVTKSIGRKLFFLNPLTIETIEIPEMYDIMMLRGFCFTSLPTSSNCIILGIYQCMSCCFVYHICQGEKKWTEVKIPEANVGEYELIPYNNPVFHNGVFYWIMSCGNLCSYDPRKREVEFLVEPRIPCKYVHINYLFESEEKLMLVLVGRWGKWVRVYELDDASMAWKEVNTLHNKAVFLSRNSSVVTDCFEMPDFEDMICFNRFIGDNKPLLYSLKTGKFGVYGGDQHVIHDFCNIPEYQIKSAWIQPSVKQHSVRELSWYDEIFNISQLFVTD